MRFEVTTLGTGAALPAHGRNHSAHVVHHGDDVYLVDCGEGTQERLRQQGVKFQRIKAIFISHLHGDHYLGLMGLLSTLHLLGRQQPLQLFVPEMLEPLLQLHFKASRTYLRYPLQVAVNPTESGICIMQSTQIQVTSLVLRHRVPCTGFVFKESLPLRKLRPEMVAQIPLYKRQAIKAGEDLQLPDGSVLTNTALTLAPPPPRSFAYCSDTAYAPELLPHLQGVDMLYHEATFANDMAARAKETMHSTAAQAATMARDAKVGQLLLGHFSGRYRSTDALLAEALAIFPSTIACQEGATYALRRADQ
jgi:ribonuclease Z